MKEKTIDAEFINLSLNKKTLWLYVIRRTILEFVKKNSGKLHGTLLDIGCGTMPYKKLILSLKKVTKYLGLDLATSKNHDTSIADLHWDGTKIPLENNSVDSILATEFLEHYLDTKFIINEMYRVLRPNGVILFTVPFIWPLHEVPNDQYRFTPYSLKRFFLDAGFKNINLTATGGWHASMAVMLGLWTTFSMRRWKRYICRPIIICIIKYLIKKDSIPIDFEDGVMMPGIGGIIIK